MKKLSKLLLMFAVIGLTACGEPVEVPPAHVGKLSTESGLQEGIIPPSKFRLEAFCINCDNLILVETSDYAVKEQMKVFIPKDQLNLDVDTRGIFSVSADEQNVEKIFNRITSTSIGTGSNRIRNISMNHVYQIYAQQVIREITRSILAEHTIMEIMSNRDQISTLLFQRVVKELKGTPIKVIRFGLADVQPPMVVINAQEARKKREVEIQRAEADKLVKLKEAEAALEVAIKQQQVDLKEAETQVLVNKKLAEGVNTAFVTQRWLKIMERMANNPDAKVFVLPSQAIGDPALMMSINQQALKKLNK